VRPAIRVRGAGTVTLILPPAKTEIVILPAGAPLRWIGVTRRTSKED